MPQSQPRNNPFVDMFPSPTAPGTPEPESVLDGLTRKRKVRDRGWEKENRAHSYTIPRAFHAAARQAQNDILSIVQHDEDGRKRDNTTVSSVATALMDYALFVAEQGDTRIRPVPTPHSRTGMTVDWGAWDSYHGAITLRPPVRRSGQHGTNRMTLSYRWEKEGIADRIAALAGSESTGHRNPLKHTVPPGELVVRLLQLAIEDYKAGKFRLIVRPRFRSEVEGWEPLSGG